MYVYIYIYIYILVSATGLDSFGQIIECSFTNKVVLASSPVAVT